jgi:hypothetical protein
MRWFLAVALTVGVLAASAPSALAAPKVVDSYCSPSGDYCAFILKKADGTVVFSFRIFPKLVDRLDVCVTKRTRTCHEANLRTSPRIWVFHIRWQPRYPKEGPGRYKVRWVDPATSDPIGPALYFRRG